MKLLELKNGENAIVDDNVFDALSQFNWMRDGTKSNSVICTTKIQGERRLHRILMNPKKGEEVDHIDGNVLNNLKSNLRVCTHKENSRNRKKNVSSKNPYKGITYIRQIGWWLAQIRVNGEIKALGVYEEPKEAAKAYNKAAIKHFGVFAKINEL